MPGLYDANDQPLYINNLIYIATQRVQQKSLISCYLHEIKLCTMDFGPYGLSNTLG